MGISFPKIRTQVLQIKCSRKSEHFGLRRKHYKQVVLLLSCIHGGQWKTSTLDDYTADLDRGLHSYDTDEDAKELAIRDNGLEAGDLGKDEDDSEEESGHPHGQSAKTSL